MKIWFLTEERPKVKVLKEIINCLNQDHGLKITYTNLKIMPIFENSIFQFKYDIIGSNTKMCILTVEGNQGSFMDHLIFHQELKPDKTSVPTYVIEETKTTPAESRNVSVYQRLTKFVFIELFDKMKNTKKIMLYNIRTEYDTIPNTVEFGIRVMKTMGIEIIGIKQDYSKFQDLDELIQAKQKFATKRSDNTAITLNRENDNVIITGKLVKSGCLAYDPNIGAITGLAKAVRILQPKTNKIIVRNHGLSQSMVSNKKNKFIKIASKLKIELDGLVMTNPEVEIALDRMTMINSEPGMVLDKAIKPNLMLGKPYWKYSNKGEKIGSIFFHLLLKSHNIKIIYENHAGCEQGYFQYQDNKLKSIEKVTNKPDLIFLKEDEKTIYLIEGEQAKNVFQTKKGIEQLDTFETIEKDYCSSYQGYACKRFVMFYGDELSQKETDNEKILFGLKTDGTILFSKYCPNWIKNMIMKH